MPPSSLPQPPAGALVGQSISDFYYENPSVFPSGAAPGIQNVTQIGPRTFNFVLRHRGNPWTPINPGGVRGAWYDGDRSNDWNSGTHSGAVGEYVDKSRAEFMGFQKLGKYPFHIGDTWLMGTTVRLDPNFVPSSRFTMLMQPVAQQSMFKATKLVGNNVTFRIDVHADGVHTADTTVREFVITRGVWTSVQIRINFGVRGSYAVSINGDPFQSLTCNTTRSSISQNNVFFGTWGLYCTATTDINGNPMKDTSVQHSNIFIVKQ